MAVMGLAGDTPLAKSDDLLIVDRLTKRFGGLWAVTGLSARFRGGTITAIIGPNGAGKTTAFSMIAGAERPTGGRIWFEGRDITGWPADRVCRAGIARTFQVVRPFWNLTVADHLRAACQFAGRGPLNPGQRMESVLRLVGLERSAGRPARTLTLADCRRLEIARALATGAHLILLDETMAGLTESETAEAIALVRRIRDEGRTVILIEHVLAAVRSLSDRVLVMDRGELIADGTPADVLALPAVRTAYLGAGG